MNLKDFTRLKGLMAMTGSDNDTESLGAIRAANRLLFTNGLTWDMVFKRTVTVVSEIEADPEAGDADELDEAFRDALDDAQPGEFRDVLLSIQAQRERGRPLSERQRKVILDAAARAESRR